MKYILIFLIMITNLYSYEKERSIVNLAVDFTECSACYMIFSTAYSQTVKNKKAQMVAQKLMDK